MIAKIIAFVKVAKEKLLGWLGVAQSWIDKILEVLNKISL